MNGFTLALKNKLTNRQKSLLQIIQFEIVNISSDYSNSTKIYLT